MTNWLPNKHLYNSAYQQLICIKLIMFLFLELGVSWKSCKDRRLKMFRYTLIFLSIKINWSAMSKCASPCLQFLYTLCLKIELLIIFPRQLTSDLQFMMSYFSVFYKLYSSILADKSNFGETFWDHVPTLFSWPNWPFKFNSLTCS